MKQDKLRSIWAGLALVLFLPACASLSGSDNPVAPEPPAAAPQAMVAAANPLAVQAGLEMLQQGGSAADAAIATMAVLGLVEPQSAGVGGGGMLLYFDARTKQTVAYDGRETAPAQATPNLFLDAGGKPLSYGEAVASGRAVGAPSLFAMLKALHEDEGKLPWAQLFAPAIRLAEQGFPIPQRMHQSIAGMLARGAFAGEAGASARAFLLTPDGQPKPAGALLTNPAYAATLRAIAASGPKALTQGPIAEAIVAAVHAEPRPGTLTVADLAAYRPLERKALCGPFRLYLICSAPPPASGGVALPELLGLYARARPTPAGQDSADDWAAFLWASRLMYADRDHYVADPAFAPQPDAALFAPGYLDARAKLIDLGKAAPPRLEPGNVAGLKDRWGLPPAQPENGTTHLSVVDADGDAVALTATIEAPFGAQRMAAGFFLNNQLTDFSFVPTLSGKPVANAPAAGKRPRSSLSPTLIFNQNGELYAALGSPGGNSIIAYVAKTIVGLVDWNLSVEDAIALPNVVARGPSARIEAGMAPEVLAALRARGWDIQANAGENSGLHVIRVLPDGRLEGGADPRREGVAAAASAQ